MSVVTLAAVLASGGLVAPAAGGDPIVPPGAPPAVRALAEANARAADAVEASAGAELRLSERRRDAEQARRAAGKTRAAATAARAEVGRAFVEVDRLTRATYQGGQLDPLGALLGSDNPRTYLEQIALLDTVTAETQTALRRFTDAAAAAEGAERDATFRAVATERAEGDARAAVGEAAGRQQQADRDVALADAALRRAGPAARAALRAGGATTVPATAVDTALQGAPGGGASAVAVSALRVALTQQGKPYVWGAAGPNSFDCSGLVQWSYRQIGVGLPKYSGAQAEVGRLIAPADARPGDLLFFNTPVSHVGIYLGGGRFVEAPQSGDVVKVSTVRPNLSSIRRVSL